MEATLLTELTEKLKAGFGADILASEQQYDFPVLTVKTEKIIDIMKALYADGFTFLTDLTGIHYPDSKGKELGVIYHLHDMPKNRRVRLKTFTSIGDNSIPTLTGIFPGANWMERETYDFFGINFKGHPNLKRILNMDEMNYFPMRKEYPLEDGRREDKDDKMFGR
ncbi:MAG: NADH-quinone oxidoreductase subunit C [Bacteroidia bacterium]|nr:NADH-quinone oxidoreductase subunit C [Bacteroidia bacterium]